MRLLHRPASRGLTAVAVLAAVAAAVCPAAAAAAGPAGPAHTAPAATSARAAAPNPYGNPYNGYLRQPYGVLPQANAGTPPVPDNPGEPFDWYRAPRAALGVFGGVQETMISPEGFLQNDFGTLQFYTGDSLTPINQRVKTWQDGWLPVAEYSYPSGGARYHVEAFDTTVPGVTKIPVSQGYGVGTRQRTASADVDNMITFARVTVTNTTSAPGTFTLGVGLNNRTITNPVHRGAPVPSDLSYNPALRALTGTGPGGQQEAALAVGTPPTTDAGGPDHTLAYRMRLAPGASQSVTVMLPYWIAHGSDLGPIENASYGAELAATDQFWTRELAGTGSDATIPEAKVGDTYKASIVALLTDALDIIGGHWYLTANPTIYNGFYLRDSAFHIEALLDAGFSDVVRRILTDYPAWQDPSSGRYVGAQSSEYDSNGEALWAIGRYEQITHDAAFARSILASVQAAMNWEWSYRQANWSTSGGLYPVNQIGDDEQVRGHLTGFNLWAISGERGAVTVAQQAGDGADAMLWSSRATRYAQILRQKLEPAFSQMHVVPPATEGIQGKGLEDGWYGGVYGIDWGNLGLVWPSGVFSPDDPMVTASLRAWQQKMFEGVFTYPANGAESLLHSYAPLSIPETYTRAGDQLAAVRYLYDTLVHTSAMGMASEGMNAAGRWDWVTANNTEPHNQFSAEYTALVHDMLAYAGQDGSLELANVYSPAWTAPGQRISFAGPTEFGPASFAITMARGGMTMTLNPPVRDTPRQIVIHTPPGTRVTGVSGVQGAASSGGQVTLPALAHRVALHVSWRVTSTPPPYSFGRAVQDYLANYHQMTKPPQLSLSGAAAGSSTVVSGDPVTATVTATNSGGAGYLASPDVTLYVNGKPAEVDSTTFARGAGFSTPRGIISFGRNTEGVVPVSFSTQICAPGRYALSVALPGQQPTPPVYVTVVPRPSTAPAPTATVTGPANVYATSGQTAPATFTVHNTGCQQITGAQLSVAVPSGWTATPTGPALPAIPPGGSAQVSYQLTAPAPPAGSPAAAGTLTATATYGWSGQTTGQASASVPVAAFSPVQPPDRTHASTSAWFGQSGGNYAIWSGGADMWVGTDQFGTIYQPGSDTSDTTAITEVTSQGDTSAWAKAGIVARNDLTASSPGYAMVAVTPGNGCAFQWDGTGGGQLNQSATTGDSVYPMWLKLVRSGSTFTGYCSTDGSAWTEVGSATVPGTAATGDLGVFASAVNAATQGAISDVAFHTFTITHP